MIGLIRFGRRLYLIPLRIKIENLISDDQANTSHQQTQSEDQRRKGQPYLFFGEIVHLDYDGRQCSEVNNPMSRPHLLFAGDEPS